MQSRVRVARLAPSPLALHPLCSLVFEAVLILDIDLFWLPSQLLLAVWPAICKCITYVSEMYTLSVLVHNASPGLHTHVCSPIPIMMSLRDEWMFPDCAPMICTSWSSYACRAGVAWPVPQNATCGCKNLMLCLTLHAVACSNHSMS